MSRTPSRPHPLAAYAEKIDVEAVYTLRQVAGLMELAPSSVQAMARHGWLPGSRVRPHARGGRRYTWTGKQLLRLANRPIRVAFDHELFSPTTLYRVGCRCQTCVDAHTVESRERRHRLSDEAFPEEKQKRLLGLVADQMPVAEAAAAVGVTLGQVYGRANWDPSFAEELDEAAWSLCVLGPDSPGCSTPSGYRGYARGRDPRPACRGTGCREWRRETSQQARAAA
ncbi:hypothetical protein [Streptomyces tirandamycinicus]|uniref:hypothetical protein n=1 Tax=Streptomyces tirandamycinicus TaxID=2174846 RepID=UPI001FC92068|nr:hypothetical protein [Streptomyces tirandamycinicus]